VTAASLIARPDRAQRRLSTNHKPSKERMVNAEERQRLLSGLNKMMQARSLMYADLNNNIKEFADRLFGAMENCLAEIAAMGIPGLGKSRRLVHPAEGGREGFQIFIEDWSIIFVPLMGFARPNRFDEAPLPPYQFKELSGRIAAFLSDDKAAQSFYDFLVFTDRSWFAWGYGWPKQHSDIENTDFDGLALDLIHSFVKDIFVTWHTRADTSLALALDTKRRAYEFGIPGEEEQGV
jgi:hypothetical protein